MAILQATDITDIVNTTLRDLGKPKFSQVAASLQRYHVMRDWLKKDRVIFDDGYGIQRTVMDKTIGAASHVGLFEEDDVNVGDHTVNMQIDHVHAQTKWGYDIREKAMNSGAAKIVDVVAVREAGAVIDMALELENRAFKCPPTTDAKNPKGVGYWIVWNTTTGFNGGLPTIAGSDAGYTTVGAISPTTSPNWKNYTADYTTFTDDDAVDKMRTAHRKIGFVAPLDRNEYYTWGKRYRIYVDDPTMLEAERLCRAQNDDLGRDLDSLDGKTRGRGTGLSMMDEAPVFRRHAFVWVPWLDDNAVASSNPIYMIDTESFHTGVLKGHYMRRTGPQQSPKQHNVYETFIDLTYQHYCINRRANAVIAKIDPVAA